MKLSEFVVENAALAGEDEPGYATKNGLTSHLGELRLENAVEFVEAIA